ncbi:hypothetical protein PoB_007639300 [Plakobranchus ocellatus]|uniref:Uncharacterized protein n=1 Tax=Plakobranchus ocellatus TaxID=259542 RepID=A0AAV4DZX5_9GAST|nr:hypothetical protein PoB_007639300 [Plakobranchus ocellatus]
MMAMTSDFADERIPDSPPTLSRRIPDSPPTLSRITPACSSVKRKKLCSRSAENGQSQSGELSCTRSVTPTHDQRSKLTIVQRPRARAERHASPFNTSLEDEALYLRAIRAIRLYRQTASQRFRSQALARTSRCRVQKITQKQSQSS